MRVVLASPPEDPGARALLERAYGEAERGADVRVLVTGRALAADWSGHDPRGARFAACARSARDRGVAVPPEFLPSSLVAFFRDLPAGVRLWSAVG